VDAEGEVGARTAAWYAAATLTEPNGTERNWNGTELELELELELDVNVSGAFRERFRSVS
jgi:hypothetical protein